MQRLGGTMLSMSQASGFPNASKVTSVRVPLEESEVQAEPVEREIERRQRSVSEVPELATARHERSEVRRRTRRSRCHCRYRCPEAVPSGLHQRNREVVADRGGICRRSEKRNQRDCQERTHRIFLNCAGKKLPALRGCATACQCSPFN